MALRLRARSKEADAVRVGALDIGFILVLL
jgi:hypothetical protein